MTAKARAKLKARIAQLEAELASERAYIHAMHECMDAVMEEPQSVWVVQEFEDGEIKVFANEKNVREYARHLGDYDHLVSSAPVQRLPENAVYNHQHDTWTISDDIAALVKRKDKIVTASSIKVGVKL